MARGHLRVYLGAAPGVGKTYAMLSEGHRRLERGTRVLVALVEDHGRPQTRAMMDGLEVVPRLVVDHRGARRRGDGPRRPSSPVTRRSRSSTSSRTRTPRGCGHGKRWQDVETLLDAGIDVITTVNVQHLESLNDTVAAITGTRQNETVPDRVVRAADQIELVDMSPEALRRRTRPRQRLRAWQGRRRPVQLLPGRQPLGRLRELALLWVADRVEEGLERYRSEHGIKGQWPARERVVVALTGGPEGDTLIRRGARIAGQAAGGELLAVHVVADDGLVGTDPNVLSAQRVLVESLGGSFRTVVGNRHRRGTPRDGASGQRDPARRRRQPTSRLAAGPAAPESANVSSAAPATSTCTWSRTRSRPRAVERRPPRALARNARRQRAGC